MEAPIVFLLFKMVGASIQMEISRTSLVICCLLKSIVIVTDGDKRHREMGAFYAQQKM